MLHVRTGPGPGNPLAFAGFHGDRAVDAGGDLEPDERPAGSYPAEEACIQRLHGILHQAAAHLDAGRLQRRPALAADRRKRVLHGNDDLDDAGLDKRRRARRRLALVRTGFQCEIGCCPARLCARGPERIDLGVRLARGLVPALAYDLAVPDQHAANHRIRMSRMAAARREAQGARHECAVRGRKMSHRPLPVLLAQQLGQQ